MERKPPAIPSLSAVTFAKRLAALRKQRRMTQQALADVTGVHVVQIRRYETANVEPTLAVLRKLAKGLGVNGDALLFDEDERGPAHDGIRRRLEAVERLDPDELRVIEEVLDGLLLKHDAKRWTVSA